ncbi:glycine betaine ABC transporter substrate-binding protein [Lentibacillus lipolyticus]|nr:glycine betaine ABC transporter substrate-binding protein [Lentibacillus lipolyticus]
MRIFALGSGKTMYRNGKMYIVFLAFVILLSIALSACGSSSDGNAESSESSANSESGANLGDKDITIPYVSWAGCVAGTNVIKTALEDVGYDVTIKQVGKGAMFTSIAEKDADAMMCTWLPNNAIHLWDKYKDDLVKLNKTIETAPIGLYVPTYMDVDSIGDLKGNEKVGNGADWTITGNDPGSGNVELSKRALKKYGLDKWEVQTSSDSAMVATLGKMVEQQKPVITTLWKPHYAFGKYDLKMLKDPKNVYGDPDSIWTVSREGLKEDSPAAYKILKQFDWTYDEMNEVMVNIRNGTDPEEAGKEFVKDHPELVEEWKKGVE